MIFIRLHHVEVDFIVGFL